MSIYTPAIEYDIPLAPMPPTYPELVDRVNAAIATIADLGMPVQVTDEDIDAARDVVMGATNAAETENIMRSPGAVIHVKAILDEYDHEIVQSSAQIRRFVTNKLIVESSHMDARIRMRALELLGKISDVGLFTEKTEITMRHRPTAELEQMLRERLAKVVDLADTPEVVAPLPSYTFDPAGEDAAS